MRVPYLHLSQERVQNDHTAGSFVDKEVPGGGMVRKPTERVGMRFGRNDRKLGKDSQTRPESTPDSRLSPGSRSLQGNVAHVWKKRE